MNHYNLTSRISFLSSPPLNKDFILQTRLLVRDPKTGKSLHLRNFYIMVFSTNEISSLLSSFWFWAWVSATKWDWKWTCTMGYCTHHHWIVPIRGRILRTRGRVEWSWNLYVVHCLWLSNCSLFLKIKIGLRGLQPKLTPSRTPIIGWVQWWYLLSLSLEESLC